MATEQAASIRNPLLISKAKPDRTGERQTHFRKRFGVPKRLELRPRPNECYFLCMNKSSYRASKFPVRVAVLLAALIFAAPAMAQNTAPNDDGVLEAPAVKKDLYPANANAGEEIDAALKSAAPDHKRVLLVFGGNWCYDCHVLDRALHEGAAGKIMKESFELVDVNIGEADKNLDLAKKYRIPLEKGVPALAVLDEDGTLLYSSGEGEFEAARSMRKKDLIAFLEHWKKSTL